MTAKKSKIAKIDAQYPDSKLIEQAVQLILKGKVIVCPTDTGYAFAANALNVRAVAQVFGLKGRDFSKPMHVAVNSIEEAGKYAQIDDKALRLAQCFLPGALTLILPKKEMIPALLVGGRSTVGIRIPDNQIMLGLTEMAGVPVTATSANLSGRPTPYAVEEIVAQLGEAIKNIALILDQGPLPVHEVSTIVDLTTEPPQLIRQGKVGWLAIREMVGLHGSDQVL